VPVTTSWKLYSIRFADFTQTNTGEIYNPATNSWATIANFPQSQFGDDPSTLLPDGRRYGSVWRHGLDAFLASHFHAIARDGVYQVLIRTP